jgi:2-oxo-4-hydroxy-4-carboxy-5-ureidoimidazoline decarboxylase
MIMPYTLAQINALPMEEFVEVAGWIFEHSPWVAERAADFRPFRSLAEMSARMNEQVARAREEEKLALLRAHPDLGTRARISESSASEQAGVGLDRLSREEYARLSELNGAYKEKFGFPFLFAVKGSDKVAILNALENRLGSSRDAEFEEALRQVSRIAQFRLKGIVTE